MTMVSRTALGIAAGIFGTLFVGYCVYFDRQRRSDPNFRKKLREKRKANKLRGSSKEQSNFPNIKDHDAVQAFFLREVQLGEELLSQGDVDGGVEHLSNAVAVCGQPNQLLQVLQQTLPPQVFHLLVQRLPAVSQKLSSSAAEANAAGSMVEDEVE
ncbi:Mitochondrial import receptor subunit tom20 [Nesidiocoris tenuis]|uniref:Mitochondrial import receptor subunit tom20 n=1 Tax=Nesidiocoris tenuis TaxID=355587 RepID=A0ABN7AEK9_9HEMI|nr:Mitochondrial import receptor subunit tom20 [Nesidiocoris tenuis]